MGQTGDVGHFQNGRSLYCGNSTEHNMRVLNWDKIMDMTLCDPKYVFGECCIA